MEDTIRIMTIFLDNPFITSRRINKHPSDTNGSPATRLS